MSSTSKYSPYPNYKDSGVEWLGYIPSEWKLTRLKFMAKIKNGKDYKTIQVDEGYPVIGSGGPFTFASDFMYDKESVLLGRKGTIDKPLYMDKPFWTVDTMYYTEISKDVCAKYLYYLALTIQFGRYSTNTALPSMTQEHLSNFTFAVPNSNLNRQEIANFLDQETGKIELLIEKQLKLIELLKEKRQAVISHAVTKGLNPNALLKDSGIAWLGQIPEHWSVKRLKFNFKLQSKKVEITDQQVIALENIESWSGKFVSTDSAYQGQDVEFQKGDILFGKLRPYLAKVYKCENFGIGLGDILVYRPETNIDSNFGFYMFLNEQFINIVDGATYGTKMPRASSEFIGEVYLSTPPKSEQVQIAKKLDIQTLKIDTLIEKSQQGIELLKERKTALISAAVTGKIDVRGFDND